MEANIIQIGNSRGVIIPSALLHSLKLGTKSKVDIYLNKESIVIKPHARQGWAAAAKKSHEEGSDNLLASDVFNEDVTEDIEW